ncbi:MAG TPA: hypothetical protein PK347_07850 [Burkholderiaceae bacterium]|nr:hypothetical protein [Burkholderiaceae bacterium]
MTSATSAESAILGIASLNPITAAIAALYSAGKSINDFINVHIDNLKQSENHTIASTGRVLESAKFGFGLGYISSVAIIAIGQLILGNNLISTAASVAGTLGSAAALSNPIAMTCGAVGAICYGWAALTKQEREAILHRINVGLEIGIELIKSIINFVITKSKELIDSKHLAEFKIFIGEQAQKFGKKLSDVTKLSEDKLSDLFDWSKKVTLEISNKTSELGSQVAIKTNEVGEEINRNISSGISRLSNGASEVVQTIKHKINK